jgi:hypothetical protein
VTATLPRADIEAARSGAGPAELVLDVRRGQGADVEAHSIAVEWSPADLEQLLSEGEAEVVTIAFDRDEVAAAMDAEADVEAHGLREKALVLTVVAVTGLSTAGVAQAHPTGGPSGTTAAAVVAPAPASVQAPAATTGGADTAGAVDQASPATTVGGAAVEAPDVIAAAAAAPATITGGATAAQAPAPSESPATTMGGAGAPPVASNTGGQIGSTGSASTLSTAEEAAIAGAAGIVIAAAGFGVAASRRRRPVQPA